MLDYTIVRQNDVYEVRDMRAIKGADRGTDHGVPRFRLMIKRKLQHNKSGSRPPCRLLPITVTVTQTAEISASKRET